ncbi:efflux RND transporter permease subunit [Spirochaetota bacterium]
MKKRLIAFFAEKSLIVNLITIAILLTGLIYIVRANKEAFPKIEFNYVTALTIYPGATAEDIEKHISIPIENQLREIEGITEIRSRSMESRSLVICKLDYDLEDKGKTIGNIKDAIEMVSDLPEEAEDPIVTEITMSLVPVLEISIFNPQGIKNDKEERELRKYVKNLEDRLRELPGVSKIDKQGYRDREMVVEVQPGLLDDYHVALNDITNALSRKNLNYPGGLIKSKSEDLMIRTIGEVKNTKEISNILIRANDRGNWVRIKDVANVKDTFEEETIINKTNLQKSITLTILKKETADIIETIGYVKKEVIKYNKKFPGYKYVLSNDLSKLVKRRLNVLINNSIVGLILVVLILFFTLGWRISLVTALGIPLAFCATFIWMGQYGVTVNLMSMFGLIVVLGMVVDDAIVVAENIYRHLEEGLPLKKAIVEGTAEVFIPILGTILTTIAAFAPLMFMSGVFGAWVWTLPAVVSIALVASWFEAMFILPSHIKDIETFRQQPIHKKNEGGKSTYKKIQKKYTDALTFILNHKYKSALAITIIFFGTIMFAAKNSKVTLFPPDKVDRFFIKAEAKTGISLEEMSQKIGKIEKIIGSLSKKELENYISKTGIIRETPGDPYEKNGSNYGMVIVNLVPEDYRKRKADEIVEDLREKIKKIMHEFVSVDFKFVVQGPPKRYDIDITIKGDDFSVMKKVAEEYKSFLKTIPGLKDVKDNFEKGKKELRIIVNEEKAAITGISVLDVASTVRSCFKGTVATKIKKTDEEIDIRVIFPEKLRNDIGSLDKIKISNRIGNLIPLNKIASFKRARGISKINRNDWKRAINVTADIDPRAKKVTPLYVNGLLVKKFADIDKRYENIIVDHVGEFRDIKDVMTELGISFIIAIFVIFIILVGIFRSLSHPLIIISIIPLSIVGVIWALYFHGMALSFLAMMGVVGLAGVVVNDSIILVNFIRLERFRGVKTQEATVIGAGKRLRAVFLTTFTTFFGLLPTAYGIGGFDPFLKSMAVSIAWGLMFGTIITLFATPILYNMFADAKRLIFRKMAVEKADEKFIDFENEMEEKIKSDLRLEFKNYIDISIKNLGKKSESKTQRKKSKSKTNKNPVSKN